MCVTSRSSNWRERGRGGRGERGGGGWGRVVVGSELMSVIEVVKWLEEVEVK